MTGQIKLTPLARADLTAIWSYIAQEASPRIAEDMLARLNEGLTAIATLPFAGRRRPEYRGTPRSFAVPPYVIIYAPAPKGGGVIVWRVVHGARRMAELVRPPR